MDFFASQNKVSVIEGTNSIENVFEATKTAVKPTIIKEILAYNHLLLNAAESGNTEAYSMLTNQANTAQEPIFSDGSNHLTSSVSNETVEFVGPMHAVVTYDRALSAGIDATPRVTTEVRNWKQMDSGRWVMTGLKFFSK